MTALAFAKYEGLGNDFIVVDAASEGDLGPRDAVGLCDRHRGIGGDGLILVLPSSEGDARMVVLNADGSRPEMCGNGLRCVALHLAMRRAASRVELAVVADAGPLTCEVERSGDRAEVAAQVGRGEGRGTLSVDFRGMSLAFDLISVGNPHAVLFEAELDAAAVDELGPSVSSRLPGGANVEIVRTTGSSDLEVTVWERGVGRTLACGTGAAAAAVASALGGRTAFGRPVNVRLPGGPLQVTVEKGTLAVRMRGPARRVFGGEVARP